MAKIKRNKYTFFIIIYMVSSIVFMHHRYVELSKQSAYLHYQLLVHQCNKLVVNAVVDFSWVCKLDESKLNIYKVWIWLNYFLILIDVKFPTWKDHFPESFTSALSNTGRNIYLDESYPQNSNNYTILIWKHGKTINRRYLNSYGTESVDPFGEQCSVHNCQLTL